MDFIDSLEEMIKPTFYKHFLAGGKMLQSLAHLKPRSFLFLRLREEGFVTNLASSFKRLNTTLLGVRQHHIALGVEFHECMGQCSPTYNHPTLKKCILQVNWRNK